MSGTRWTLKDQRATVEVWKDRTRHSTENSIEQARAEVARLMEPGDTVHHEERDGYRTTITRSFRPRRGWRR